MFSYCALSLSHSRIVLTLLTDGIAGSITISVINYVLLGFQFPVDGFFMHSFEIWLATTAVFWGSGTIGYTLLEYRLGHKKLVSSWGPRTLFNLSSPRLLTSAPP
jgi:hypothetical protein